MIIIEKVLTKNYWASLILIALLVASAIFGSTSLIFDASSTEFELLSPLVIASICLLFCLVCIALSIIVVSIAAWLRLGWVGIALLLWLSLFATVAGLLAPLPVGVGMTNLVQYEVSLSNLALSIVSATALTFLFFTPISKVMIWGVAAFCLSSLVQAGSTLASLTTTQDNQLLLSEQGNILVISFDGLQRDVFAQALTANSELVDRLRNFTEFSNVASSSPATNASTSAEVLGNMNFKQVVQTQKEFTDLALGYGTPVRLAQAGFRIGTYGVYSSYGKPEENLAPLLGKANSADDIAALIQNVASRIIGPQIAASGSIQSTATAVGNFFADKGDAESDHFFKLVANHKGLEWDRPLLRSLDAFNNYEDRLAVTAASPAAHFLHFTFTHHPVDFDERCQFRSNDQAWYESHQNREGLLGEARCSITLLEGLLKQLDNLNVLNNSLVVIKSDHGAPVSWNDPDMLSGQSIHAHPDWGVGRYMPILLIKKPDEEHSIMAVDDRPVILDDLAVTICRWADLAKCNQYAGANLLDPEDTGPANIWINIVADPTSNFRYEDHVSVDIQRAEDPVANLHRQVLQSSVRPLDCDANIRRPADLPIALWREKETQFLKLKNTSCEDLILILSSTSGLGLAVSANRMDAAEISSDTLLATFKVDMQGEVNASITSTTADRWSLFGLATVKKIVDLNTDLAVTPDLLLGGWHPPEEFGAWSAETSASVQVDFEPDLLPREMEVKGRILIASGKSNGLKIFVNGILSADLRLNDSAYEITKTVAIPPESFRFTSTAVVTFDLDEINSPAESGLPDQRKLGFGLEKLIFRQNV